MQLKSIRNFSIIAHIDHGKSTLADRMLEITHTIEDRKMQDQVLDSMELERERGITIKMQPVRMQYSCADENGKKQDYILNLIDTPGHIDFSYEVSRALKAVEGSILLVDATQGVQAQTLTTLNMAREIGLKIIPVVSKIDSPLAKVDEVTHELAKLLECDPSEVIGCSGRTGQGVDNLLQEIIKRVPPPKDELQGATGTVGGGRDDVFRSLVFDFKYDNHKGVIVYIRVVNGSVQKNDSLQFKVAGEKFIAMEVGTFSPQETARESLGSGEIGYIVTGIKQPGIASVGDTVSGARDTHEPLHGYMTPSPVVWASVYPESQDDFDLLHQALGRLRLSDSSFSYEEESSGTLGRGFRCGFLGMLHLEIITERLRREFNLELVVTVPSITYNVELKNGKKVIVYSAPFFPGDHEIARVFEPWAKVVIITPSKYLGDILGILFTHEAEVGESETFGEDRVSVSVAMPLRELMRNFFDELKSISAGYASISYTIGDLRPADVVRLDILVADEPVPAFARVVSRKRAEEEAETSVDRLFSVLPHQLFTTKIQGFAMGRILSSKTLTAMQKNVTQHMYGGDRTRKMKLWKKQKEGKKRMKERGKVNIPQDVFIKMMKKD